MAMVETHPAVRLVREEHHETLRSAFGRGIERARAERSSILVSTVIPAEPLLGEPAPSRSSASGLPLSPLSLFGQSRAMRHSGFYWERPAECTALVGVGMARELSGGGVGLAQVEAEWQALLDAAIVQDAAVRRSHAGDGVLLAGPLLLGGAAFDPLREPSDRWDGFPAARFVVPRYMLSAQDSERWLTVNAVVDPDARIECELAAVLQGLNAAVLGLPSEADAGEAFAFRGPGALATEEPSRDVGPAERRYENLVRLARSTIRQGDAEKIVLAQSIRLSGAYSPAGTLAELRRVHPGCTLFAVGRGESCFLGATPERLVCRRGRTVQVDALAGTVGRGVTPEEDSRLAADLLASHKDQTEHAVVVAMIRDSLEPVCDRISVPKEPVVRRLRTVQHLSTSITGRLRGEAGILALVARLHPTPAVGGLSREVALRFLRRHEGLDRGWYAGPIGWVCGTGDGDFVVGIRSMLLRSDEAVLFAGCGIMADSDPAREYAESCLKLDSIRCALARSLKSRTDGAGADFDVESASLCVPEQE